MMMARMVLPLVVVAAVAFAWPSMVMAQQVEDEILVEADALGDEEEVDVSRIDQILRGDQDVREGGFVNYDDGGRRDPFRSLLDTMEGPEEEGEAARPPGLPGMLVEELELEGIIETPSGILAFVLGRDDISYIIRPGTKLYNGEVKEILQDRVVFRQQADDPKQLRPYEEVVRGFAD